MDKPFAVAIWISINLLCSCQSVSRPGAEVAIGVDDAVAVLALERADEDDGLATDDPPTLELGDDCEVAALRRAVIVHYDADRDGMLDADETGALRRDFGGRSARGKPRQLARLERIKLLRWVYDANADRALDTDERQTLRDDLDMRCLNDRRNARDRKHEHIEQHARAFARFDANHDGRLDTRELAAAREARRKRIVEHWRTLVDRFDTDGNRLLNTHERAALREYERSVVRGERVAAPPVKPSNPDAGGDASHGL